MNREKKENKFGRGEQEKGKEEEKEEERGGGGEGDRGKLECIYQYRCIYLPNFFLRL